MSYVDNIGGGSVDPSRLAVLVDDDDGVRGVISILLQRKGGYEVEVAKNGQEGIDLITRLKSQGKKIDVLITDRQMPQMDGFGLLDSFVVKSDKNMVKIMMSGQGIDESIAQFRNETNSMPDSVCFLEKPVPWEKIAESIEEAKAKIAVKTGPSLS